MPQLNRAGTFHCRVLASDNWIGQEATGTMYVGLPLEVIEGNEEGCHITAKMWLSEKAFDRTIARLAEVFGWDGDLGALVRGEFSFEDLECSIETEMEPYTTEAGQARQSCKVKWVNSLGRGGSGIKPADSAALNSLVARMNGRAQATARQVLNESGREPAPRQPRATGTPSPNLATGPTAAVDDLPF